MRTSHEAGVPAVPTVRGFGLVTRPYTTLPEFFLATARRHGTFVRFRNLRRAIYFTSEPALVEDVLVTKAAAFMKGRGTQRLKRLLGNGLLTAEAPGHLQRRRLMQPAFHRKRIDGYAEVILAATRHRSAAWREDDVIEIDREANRLTLEIVARALFGADLSHEMETISSSLDIALAAFPMLMLPFSELFDRVPLPATLRLDRAKRRLDAVVERMMRAHRAGGGDAGDVLSMLLAARDEAGAPLDDRQIVDEALTILLAGHETTANAIAWTFYLLQRHPDVEAKLARHVADVLAGRPATLDDVARLTYVRAVFAETMRLYPPAWVTARRALEPVTLGPHPLRRGDIAIVSQYVSHRDPRYFPDPERFDPERWSGPPPPKFAYFPFGGGNRVCIGESFAWLEGILVIATIVQRARLMRTSDEPVATLPLVTLRPRTPIYGRVSLRTPSSLQSARV